MALKKIMYPGQVNSRETITTSALNATDTSLTVLDGGLLPDAPNLLVLGAGSTAETVLMTAKDGNVLTLQRGFQGVPKTWALGTVVARNYTEYDYAAMLENITDVEGRVTDNSSQIGQNSNKIAQLSNPNLLINGDFQIWQRGTSFGDIFQQYSADRWHCTKTSGTHSFKKVQNGITITNTGVSYLTQFIENSVNLKNKKLTATISVNNKLYSVTGVPINNPVIDIENGRMAIQWDETRQTVNVLVRVNSGETIINWVKLELGEIATLLCPRSYGEELALCQRYYEKGSYSLFPAITSTNITGRGFKVTKRTTPTIFIVSERGTVNRVSTASGQDLDKHASANMVYNEGFRQVNILEGITIGEPYIYTWLADSEIY